MFLLIFVCKKVEALFEIAHMIAIEKKSHNICKTFIKTCMLKAADLVLEKTYTKKMAKISLLDCTIKTPTDKFPKSIECQVFKELPAFFSIQCDETTNISQLLIYVCFN